MDLPRTPSTRSSQRMSSGVGRQPLAESRAATLLPSLENTNAPGLQFRARVSDGVERLTPMQNRKTADGFAFSALLNEDGAGRLELTKA